jgi:hypothetical protein
VFPLLIASSPSIKAATTCNSFPKIFGGNSGNTLMYHFDVYNDFLAMGGHTDGGNLLTGIATINYFPYLALQ